MKTFAGTFVLFAGLSVVAAGQTPTPKPALPPVPAEPMAASVDGISNDAARYYGKTVRVVEDVARVLAPRIFTLDEEAPLRPGQDVMVVAPRGVTVREDEDAAVVGVVREFTWSELEKEKFDFDLKREWQVEFKSRPVIYATSVKPKATY
jgi:hypothetical protein